MSQIRVHLADSDHFSRGGISGVLSTAEDIVVEASTGCMDEAVDTALTLKPHVLLLETSLEGEDLSRTIREVLSQSIGTKIIVMAQKFSREEAGMYYELGCSGAISKSNNRSELPSAIRMVAEGYQLFARPVEGWLKPLQTARRSANASLIKTLETRDLQLVKHVAMGLTNAQIARAAHISEGSVKLHLARIMDLLNITNRVQLAVIAAETGLVSSADLY